MDEKVDELLNKFAKRLADDLALHHHHYYSATQHRSDKWGGCSKCRSLIKQETIKLICEISEEVDVESLHTKMMTDFRRAALISAIVGMRENLRLAKKPLLHQLFASLDPERVSTQKDDELNKNE